MIANWPFRVLKGWLTSMIVYFSPISATDAYALLAREIPHDWFPFFSPKSLLKTRIINFGIPTSTQKCGLKTHISYFYRKHTGSDVMCNNFN